MVAAAPPRLVPAVDRAARVLAFLEAEGRPLGISELARRLNASKGTVRDVLETLRSHGLLERDDANKHYRLGPRLVRLGHAAQDGRDLARIAGPFLTRLAEETGETALLLTRQGDRALIVAKAEPGRTAMRVSAPVGRRIPLIAGAVGKMFLAFAEEHVRADHLDRLPRFTEGSITDRSRFEAELGSVRRLGYALDDEEYLDGVRAAAAPVLNAQGHLVAVLLAVGLAGSLTTERLARTAAATAGAAEQLSGALGAPRTQEAHTP
jgi:IclR family acetate operon transcriptional repressor